MEEKNEEQNDILYEDESETPDVIKKLKEELKKCQKERQEYLEGWQRAKADYINSRRAEEENQEKYRAEISERIITDLLSVIDSFELAYAHMRDVSPQWKAGLEGIHKSFLSALSRHNLTTFKPLGEVFNPLLHEAVESVPTSKEEENEKVVEVLQPGYKIREKVIRAAKVKVGKLK